MKYVLVPPGMGEPLLSELRKRGTLEDPRIDLGGVKILTSRACPPDTAYVLNEVPEIKPIPTLDPWWDCDDLDGPPRGLVFSIDYSSFMYSPRRPPPVSYSRRQRLRNRLWWWRVRYLSRVIYWWNRMREESRSPFAD